LFFLLNTTEKPLEGLRTVVVKSKQEQPAIFAERFLRAYRLLDFIACRVLCDKKRAQIAIHNCWQTASRNPPRFEFEGAFRSWLARVLIDEALAILRESQGERDATAADVNAASVSDNTVKPGLG
jgi:DNA-directed RNA polymerase specialized sigma24 family protein